MSTRSTKKPGTSAPKRHDATADPAVVDRHVKALVTRARQQLDSDMKAGRFLVMKNGSPWGPITFWWFPAGLRQHGFDDEQSLSEVLGDVFGPRLDGVQEEAAGELMDSILAYVNKCIASGA